MSSPIDENARRVLQQGLPDRAKHLRELTESFEADRKKVLSTDSPASRDIEAQLQPELELLHAALPPRLPRPPPPLSAGGAPDDGSAVSTSTPAPRRKHPRVSSGGDDDAAFYDEAGDDDKFFASYPTPQIRDVMDVGPPQASSSALAKENTGRSPPSRKVQRQERHRTAKEQSLASGGNEKAKGKSQSVLTPRATTTYGPPTSGKGKGKVDALLNEESDIVDEDGAVTTNMLVNEDSYIVDEDATNIIPKPWRRPKLTKDEASERIDSMWSTAFTACVNWVQDSQTALQVVGPAVDQLFDVHQVGAHHQHIESINTNHPILRHLPVGASTFLLDIARGHRASAVETAVRNGILVYSRPDEAKDAAGQITYVRVASEKQDSYDCSPAACLERYMLEYPSDLGWAAAGLVFLGKTATQIKQIVKKVVESRKISLPPSQLFRALEDVDELPGKPTFSGFPLYYGISDEHTPDERLQADLKEGQTRFSNFAKANEDFVNFQAYGIPTCYVPRSTGIHTDRDAGDVEVFVIHTSNGIGLNHAIGGNIPYFRLPADVSALISSSSVHPHPFGTIPVPEVAAKVTQYVKDQKRFLSQSDVSGSISQTAYQRLLRDGPGVFLSNNRGVAGIRLLDIISLENYDSRRGRHEVGGLWEERSGRALKTFRQLVCLMEPHLPTTGDLDEANIAKFLGPTLDLWPLSPKPIFFWLHCLWTSRILIEMDVVVSTTWSAVPDATIGGGFLGLAWRNLPQEIQTEVLSGVTPPNIQNFLPPTDSPQWTPSHPLRDEYTNNIGVLRIVQHGPSPTHLHLQIPNIHAGVIKHESECAFEVALIILLVEWSYRVALSEVNLMRSEGHVLQRISAEETLHWFHLLRDRVEARLVASGLRQKLEEVKKVYRTHGWARAHLRRTVAVDPAPRNKAEDYHIPGITNAVGIPGSAERLAQFEVLQRDYEKRLDYGGNPDPFHHIGFPFDNDPFGPDMKKWFLSLAKDVRIAYSARAFGSNPIAYANATRTRAALPQNKAALSLGGHRGTATMRAKSLRQPELSKALLVCIEKLADRQNNTIGILVGGSFTSTGFRSGLCEVCGGRILASTTNCSHTCSSDAVDLPSARLVDKPIRDKNFPSLQGVRYLHDLLRYEDLLELLEAPLDQQKPPLVAVSVYEILSRSRNKKVVDRYLPGLDLSLVRDLKVYRKQKETDEAEWELTLAVDACLALVSRCPPQLWPTTAADRGKAWTHSGQFDKWGPGNGRHFVRCSFGYVGVLQPSTQAQVFLHTCNRTKALLEKGTKNNKSKGGPQDCDSEVTMDKHLIKDEFDLPPDYLRARWFHRRVFPKLDSSKLQKKA
ncbi:hypothetical protein DFH08DRAFT_1079735 [Mycena albidolilacea]|uniref:Uncharacterized protein n=1 Tax=Mycena albidolilacea TaxID=1033008 RepID=A0AAD7ESD0_9AGAR|nr:hypothetical protein DFH08DRAFT_1079735 [Mycena albidolilacea]